MYFRVADWLKAIAVTVALVLIYLFIGTVTHTILLIVGGAFIAFLVEPILAFLQRKGARRTIAILATFVLFFGIITILISLIGPSVIDQLEEFVANVPDYFQSLQAYAENLGDRLRRIPFLGDLEINAQTIIEQLSGIATAQVQNLLGLIPSLIALATDIVLIIVIAIYLLVYLPTIDKFIKNNVPEGLVPTYNKFLGTMQGALSRYFLGQLALMVAVGVASGIAVWIIGLPFPTLLGLWAGLTEIIPILGPVLGAIPAIIVALTIDPVLALWVILAFVIIQQLEGNVLGPVILGQTVGLNPIIIIIGIIAGSEIAGLIGVFLAVPVLVVVYNVSKFIRDNFSYQRVEDGPDRLVVEQEQE